MVLNCGFGVIDVSLSMSSLISDHFKTMNLQPTRLSCHSSPQQMISRASESSPSGPLIRLCAYVGSKRLSKTFLGFLAFPPTGTQGWVLSAMDRCLARLMASPTGIPFTIKSGGTENNALSNIDFSTVGIWVMLFSLENSAVNCLRTLAASFIIFVRGGGVGWC